MLESLGFMQMDALPELVPALLANNILGFPMTAKMRIYKTDFF